METLVRNPETGRWIKKEGTLYQTLIKKGIKVLSKPSRQRRAFVRGSQSSSNVREDSQVKSQDGDSNKILHTRKQNLLKKCISLNDYQKAAKVILPKAVYEYVASGAEDEQTLYENQMAFKRFFSSSADT